MDEMPRVKPKGHHIIASFADETTMHGLPKIIKATGRCTRLVWTTIFVCALVAFLSHISVLLHRYFSYDINTVYSETPPQDVALPWVTVCPANPYSLTSIPTLREENKKSRFIKPNRDYGLWSEISSLNPNTKMEKFYQVKAFTQNMDPICRGCSESRSTLTPMLLPYLSLDYSPTLLETEIQCTTHLKLAEGMNYCHDILEKESFNTYAGVCHTYKFTENVSKRIEALALLLYTGGTNIMQLDGEIPMTEMILFQLNANMGYAVMNPSLHQGSHIYIHPANTNPKWDGHVKVVPGNRVDIKYTTHKMKRLSAPYDTCADIDNEEKALREMILKGSHPKNEHFTSGLPYRWLNMSQLQSWTYYQQQECMEFCKQRLILKHIGCLDIELPIPRLSVGDYKRTVQKIPICLNFGQGTLDQVSKCADEIVQLNMDTDLYRNSLSDFPPVCGHIPDILANISYVNEYKKNMSTEFETDITECNCPLSCNEEVYFPSHSKQLLSDIKFPDIITIGYNNLLFNHVDDLIAETNLTERWHFTEDLSFEDYVTEVRIEFNRRAPLTEEVPDYIWSQLLADLGGAAGLWIGISFVTFTEVLSLLSNLVRSSFRRRCRKRPQTETHDKPMKEMTATDAENGPKENID